MRNLFLAVATTWCLLLAVALSAAETAPAPPAAEEVVISPTRVYNGKTVADPQARGGYALVGDHDFNKSGPGRLAWDVYLYRFLPGKIHADFRLKVADNTVATPVITLSAYAANGGDLKAGQSAGVSLKGTDFAAANTYQEFPLDFLMGEKGFGVYFVGSLGGAQVTFGGLAWQQATTWDLPQLLDNLKMPVKPAGLVVSGLPFTVHEAHGLYMELWGVRPAVGLIPAPLLPGAAWTESYLNVHPQNTTLKGFPAKYEDLYKCRAVVLNNVPAKAVGVAGTLMLKDYLQDGGCVLLMGDTNCFVEGGWDKSVLAPLLPVTLVADDRAHPDKPLALTPRQDWIRGLHLDWGAAPYTVYYHKLTVKPEAQVLAGAGSVPLVVQEKVGRGRFVVFLNSVLGEQVPGAPGLPFWEWKDWPKFMAAVLAGEEEYQ